MMFTHMARLTVTIPDLVSEDLQRWADIEGRTKAGLTSYVIEAAVRDKFPEHYPPPDAYRKGFQGAKTDPTSQISGDRLKESATILAKLIDGEELTREEEEVLAKACDRTPHNVHNAVKKIRSKNGSGKSEKS